MEYRVADGVLVVVCDGCGRETRGDKVDTRNQDKIADMARALVPPDRLGLGYCPDCAERRADDPAVTVQGRTMTVSELMMQAEDDKDLAAALPGDSLQEQIDNKQALKNVQALAEDLKKWASEGFTKRPPSSSGKVRP